MKCRMKRFLEKIEMNRREMLKVVLAAPLGLLVEEEKEAEIGDKLTIYDNETDRKEYRWVQVYGHANVTIAEGQAVGVMDNRIVTF